MNRILVYIPARGGSKGIPKKNLHSLLGKPLIGYTFDLVKKLMALLPGRILPFLSTDDEEILKYSNISGFPTTYQRPAHLSGDSANIADGIEDALNWLKIRDQVKPANILLLQPTSPLLTAEQALAFIEEFDRRQLQSQFSVIPMKQHPYECIEMAGNNWEFLASGTNVNQRQSYADNFLFIDGSFYMVSNNFFTTHHSFIVKDISEPFVINDKYLVDIDEPVDLAVAEAVMRQRGVNE